MANPMAVSASSVQMSVAPTSSNHILSLSSEPGQRHGVEGSTLLAVTITDVRERTSGMVTRKIVRPSRSPRLSGYRAGLRRRRWAVA